MAKQEATAIAYLDVSSVDNSTGLRKAPSLGKQIREEARKLIVTENNVEPNSSMEKQKDIETDKELGLRHCRNGLERNDLKDRI